MRAGRSRVVYLHNARAMLPPVKHRAARQPLLRKLEVIFFNNVIIRGLPLQCPVLQVQA